MILQSFLVKKERMKIKTYVQSWFDEIKCDALVPQDTVFATIASTKGETMKGFKTYFQTLT